MDPIYPHFTIKTYKDINQSCLTHMLKRANLIQSTCSVVKFNCRPLDQEKSLGNGNVYLLENVLLLNDEEGEESRYSRPLVLKFPGKPSYRSGLEMTFYSKCAYSDQLLVPFLAIFKLNESSINNNELMYLIEYVEKTHWFRVDDSLPEAFIYAILKEMARFHAMNIYNKRAHDELPLMFDQNGQEWLMTKRLNKHSKLAVDVIAKLFPEKATIFNKKKLENRLNAAMEGLKTSKYTSVCHYDSWLGNFLIGQKAYKKLSKI
jgi:hypothetical protein